MALGCIGLFANFQAMAQQYPPPNGPAAPQNGTAQGNPQPAVMAAPQPAANPATDEGLLIDNGLWTDASVGECCSACGGGSGGPPDWYTEQGVRVMSHSKTRYLATSFRAPPQGNFEVVASGTGTFQILQPPVPITTLLTATGLPGTSFGVMSTKTVNLDAAPGYEFTVGHYFCRDKNNNDHFVEFTYWGLSSWSDARTVGGFLVPVYDQSITNYSQAEANLFNSGAATPVTLPGQFFGSLRSPYPEIVELPEATDDQKTLSFAFNNGLLHSISYRSTMYNFEINGRLSPRGEPDRLVLHPDGKWRRECQPGTYMSYLYGVRIMSIDESFNFRSWSEGLDPFVANSVTTGHGAYATVTHNTLLGLQIGADMTFRNCRWAWGVHAKMGPYVNMSDQDSTIEGSIDNQAQHNVNQRLTASKSEASLVGEVGFQATYKFRPNLMGRVGYDFMWITGLALAPDQLQLVASPVNRVNTNGTLFSQGVTLGLEWMW
jgi:hypothetical protein